MGMDEERSDETDDGAPETATGAGAGLGDDPDDEGDAFVVEAP
jgi:hypothetical protein